VYATVSEEGDVMIGVISGLVRGGEQPVEAVVGTRDAPTEVIALTSLASVDYLDLFTMPVDTTATPEGWARAMFGSEPSLGERLIWRVLLGLRLARGRSAGTVAGWRITGRGPDWIRLETRSRLMTANLVVRAAAGTVALATMIHHDRPAGRWLWTPASALHRLLVPGVLRRAATVVRRRGSTAPAAS
jgi:hypothetical protein